MHSNSKQARRQQQRLPGYATNAHADNFYRLLQDPAMKTALPAHRERTYPPLETLSMFMAQALGADRSCQYAVNNLSVRKAVQHSKLISTSTSGYCQARGRLLGSVISSLVRHSGQLMDQEVPNAWRCRTSRTVSRGTEFSTQKVLTVPSYLMYDAIVNGRVRPSHIQWNSKVIPVDVHSGNNTSHPMWRSANEFGSGETPWTAYL